MKYLTKNIYGLIIICILAIQMFGPVIANADDEVVLEGHKPNPYGEDSSAGSSSTSITPESINLSEYLLTDEQKDNQGNPLASSIGEYIVRVINFLSMTIGSFAILAVIIGGVFLLTAGGREESVTRGKDIIKYAIMGILFAVSAYFIVALVQNIIY